MIKGTLLALCACLVWGFIFVIPSYIVGFDAFETALGRHFVYGSLSTIILLCSLARKKMKFPWLIWKTAFLFSLLTNMIYYSCVVMGIRHSTPAITALILGLSPVAISFYGNLMKKEVSFKSLIIPAILTVIGLILINLPVFEGDLWNKEYLLGLTTTMVALVIWSWYIVANADFLKKHPEICGQSWATATGATTFFWVLILGTGYETWHGAASFSRFLTPSPELWTFVGGCLILGLFCSWVGASLWNKASSMLPISFAGQLTVFETIFGVVFIYAFQQSYPSFEEFIGICLMLTAILYATGLTALKPAATTVVIK